MAAKGTSVVTRFEQVVRRDLKALYDFLCEVYPAVDIDPVIDATFEQAGRWRLDEAETRIRFRLFGEARAHIRCHHDDSWRRHNCAVVRATLHEHARRTRDWHTWTELSRVTGALEVLSVEDHELLNIAEAVETNSAEDLAWVLRSPTEEVRDRLDGARGAFRQAYDRLLPGEGSLGAES